jgi:hypothetical protein
MLRRLLQEAGCWAAGVEMVVLRETEVKIRCR